MISMSFITANSEIRERSIAIASASSAASSMWRRRMPSASLIFRRGRHHFIAEATAQIADLPRADLPAEHLSQFPFHPGHAKQTGHVSRFEIHQDVDIAVGSKAQGQHRTEERQFANLILPTKKLRLEPGGIFIRQPLTTRRWTKSTLSRCFSTGCSFLHFRGCMDPPTNSQTEGEIHFESERTHKSP